LTKEEALKRLPAKKVPSNPIPEIEEVLEDPQLKFRGMIQELSHLMSGRTGINTAGCRVHFSEHAAGLDAAAPYPGQHSEEIYPELRGVSQEEMAKLKEEEVT
jgi:crotonobetainyl-CoA:carnitine CoA-transferase CaiB-like acyl-CoA transferase